MSTRGEKMLRMDTDEDDDTDEPGTELDRIDAAQQRLAAAGRAAEAAIASQNSDQKEHAEAFAKCLDSAERACTLAKQHAPSLSVEQTSRGVAFRAHLGAGTARRGTLNFTPDQAMGKVRVWDEVTVNRTVRGREPIIDVDPLDYDETQWSDAIATFLENVANARDAEPAKPPPRKPRAR